MTHHHARLIAVAMAAVIVREAGPDLTTESFLDALESLKFSDKVTGVETEMSETNHRAGSGIILSQVQDGIWRPVAEME